MFEVLLLKKNFFALFPTLPLKPKTHALLASSGHPRARLVPVEATRTSRDPPGAVLRNVGGSMVGSEVGPVEVG